jgi:hypothetical protein
MKPGDRVEFLEFIPFTDKGHGRDIGPTRGTIESIDGEMIRTKQDNGETVILFKDKIIRVL